MPCFLLLPKYSVNFIPSQKKKKVLVNMPSATASRTVPERTILIKIDFCVLYLCEATVRYSFCSYLVSHNFPPKATFWPFVILLCQHSLSLIFSPQLGVIVYIPFFHSLYAFYRLVFEGSLSPLSLRWGKGGLLWNREFL